MIVINAGEGLCAFEEADGCDVVVVDAAEDGDVPEVVGHAEVVEDAAGAPALGDEERVDDDAGAVAGERLEHGQVEEEGGCEAVEPRCVEET
ncbi:hypothetical protein TRICI_005768 [Trichomonascus ciferrii]|uniref:Uncharacterized protein n=1 Tax=Trichomonascus ciferrii TaxID=44093 RepID=A0A642UPV0_9ASCO|nr:hypothetical protein TRICI_005768 [Trichomonascus ciferrii]